ncbi:hypothetical protein JGU66_02330 [Myxococcaceae bacterium JPH2]|nr:hypothetical protein [Myxococcaceae bacterium JPH2]
MLGARPCGTRAEVTRCIDASTQCQRACEQGVACLLRRGLRPDDTTVRLLRQCAELCELNVRALRKESRLVRHTASLCFELGNQVARATWLRPDDPAACALARDALQLARACQPLVFPP